MPITGIHKNLKQVLFLWFHGMRGNAITNHDMLIEKAESTLILYNSRFTSTSQYTGDKHCRYKEGRADLLALVRGV